MTDALNLIEHNLASLKRAFDSAFQEAVAPQAADMVHLLTVRIAGATFALDLAELGGVVLAPRIIPIPAPVPGLLGLAGVKAKVVAVYSLAVLVGGQHENGEAVRWIALSGRDASVGLAFSQLAGVQLVARSAVRPVTSGSPAHATGMIAYDSSPIWLLGVASITAPEATGNSGAAPAGKGEK